MREEKVIIIGAGPCGMSAAIELQKRGIEPLIIEKGNVVNSIYNYPTHQTFFSSSDRLEIGEMPFVTERQKPVRNEALSYYRTVAERFSLRIHAYEKVNHIIKQNDRYIVHTETENGIKNEYVTTYVIIATGYYDNPNMLKVKGEELPHVSHYFKEAHPYYQRKVVIIGGKNSAVDAAIELERVHADVTVLYRGNDYSSSVKPWILPLFQSLVNNEKIKMVFNATIEEITSDSVKANVHGEILSFPADKVFAMTGYEPDQSFLRSVGITIDHETGRPHFDEQTMETNIDNIYIAGVIAAGYNNNEIFIENGRFHGELIAKHITKIKESGE